mmetsp:Transcript_110255/g.322697  ORF Transcript_110255/g.322697 Transcript_110255/m.322697 type:complete len:301 (-) Transcript_110255:117-1019(-)
MGEGQTHSVRRARLGSEGLAAGHDVAALLLVLGSVPPQDALRPHDQARSLAGFDGGHGVPPLARVHDAAASFMAVDVVLPPEILLCEHAAEDQVSTKKLIRIREAEVEGHVAVVHVHVKPPVAVRLVAHDEGVVVREGGAAPVVRAQGLAAQALRAGLRAAEEPGADAQEVAPQKQREPRPQADVVEDGAVPVHAVRRRLGKAALLSVVSHLIKQACAKGLLKEGKRDDSRCFNAHLWKCSHVNGQWITCLMPSSQGRPQLGHHPLVNALWIEEIFVQGMGWVLLCQRRSSGWDSAASWQ